MERRMSNREILELSEVIRESGLDWNAFIEEYQENGEDLHLSYDDFLAQCILESGYHKEQRQNDPLTNADRIRAMGDEELASYIVNHRRFDFEKTCLGWLKQPYKEG